MTGSYSWFFIQGK